MERFAIPTPFPVGDVNAYYFPGREPALVDPGPNTPAARATLARLLDGRPVRRVVLTHQHADHAGLAATLRREHGAQTVCHADDAAALEAWSQRAPKRLEDYAAGLLRAGVPAPQREGMRRGGIAYDAIGESVRIDRAVGETDPVVLGDATFTVIHAPGHTPGSILLHDPERLVTLSGDTLLASITPNAVSVRASERDALPTYLQTLARLQQLPLGSVRPGHGRAFDDAALVISRGLRHATARQARLLRLVREGPGTAWQLALRLFLRLPEDQLFLAVSETLGHLEQLQRLGAVQKRDEAGADVYAAAR